MPDINKAGLKMYVKRKLKNTYTNFTVGEFLLVQKLGKHPLSTESGATMGGTDISLGRISGALAGASHWNKNREIERAAKRDGLGNAATALRAQYGFGDGMQRMQLESILKGDTRLARGTGTGEAETVAKDGKRTVYLDNYKDTMSREEQLAMGITLGHEAYRDGLVGSGQQQFMETARAVIGHTELALRMQSDARYTKSLDNIIAGSDILQKDIDAYKSGDMMTMLDHVAGNYDWSKDYWKLMKDGSLIDDDRSSLFLETNEGDEFKIWDMEGLKKDEALAYILNTNVSKQEVKNAQAVIEDMKQHDTTVLLSEVISDEVKKRVGLYSIVRAETSLSEEAFDQIALNSFKINDALGYYIDLSIVEKDLVKKHLGGPSLHKPNDIMEPSSRYNFNGENAHILVNGYGTLFALGTSFEYRGAWGPKNTTPNIPSDNFRSIDELAYTQQNIADIHNKNLRAMGRPAIKLDRKGHRSLFQQYTFAPSPDSSVTPIANGLSLIAQYSMGVQNAVENLVNIQIPTWSINGTNYFSVVGQSFISFERKNGTTVLVTGPDFYSEMKAKTDKRVQNYADYIEKGKPFLLGIWGRLSGWSY
ncbi:hypothetical protein H0R92_08190 [Treponema sp. OMZ 840]|uniref:hypothetical protein n=1 Tax=Treponema sp. OMZ 840 TaxID=244313 RepID=UPI003D8B0B22